MINMEKDRFKIIHVIIDTFQEGVTFPTEGKILTAFPTKENARAICVSLNTEYHCGKNELLSKFLLGAEK